MNNTTISSNLYLRGPPAHDISLTSKGHVASFIARGPNPSGEYVVIGEHGCGGEGYTEFTCDGDILTLVQWLTAKMDRIRSSCDLIEGAVKTIHTNIPAWSPVDFTSVEKSVCRPQEIYGLFLPQSRVKTNHKFPLNGKRIFQLK